MMSSVSDAGRESPLPPSAVGRNDVPGEAALRRGGEQWLALFKIELEMRRLAVRLQGGFIAIDYVEIETIRIVTIAQHVEAQASRLVLLRMLRIVAHDFEKFRGMLRLHLDGDVQDDHG